MNDESKTITDTPDIISGCFGYGGEIDRPPQKPPCAPPIPAPPGWRHYRLMSEGCLCVALLSLATTVISLTLLRK